MWRFDGVFSECQNKVHGNNDHIFLQHISSLMHNALCLKDIVY